MKHLHYEITAFESREDDRLNDAVGITVIDAQNEQEALEKAKKIIVRPFYRTARAWECQSCAAQEEHLATQRYMAALLGKHMRGDAT